MTDYELLEQAAQAAGKSLVEYEWYETPSNPEECGFIRYMGDGTHIWNPLRRDGDALRLAVRLGIHVTNSDTDAWASHLAVTATTPLAADPYAATRRAIVRAAAAMADGGER